MEEKDFPSEILHKEEIILLNICLCIVLKSVNLL